MHPVCKLGCQVMCDIFGPGEIYLVHTRHCIDTNQSIYKIGRAQDAGQRLRGYPKGSVMKCRLCVSRMKDSEDFLKILCRNDVIQRLDYGVEYYEGSILVMIQKLLTAADMFPPAPADGLAPVDAGVVTVETPEVEASDVEAPEVQEVVHEVDAVKAEETLVSQQDATLLLGAYIRDHMAELSSQPVDSAVLLDKVTCMLRDAGCMRGATPTMKALSKTLHKYFGAEEVMCHKFQDGVRHATVFKAEPEVPLVVLSKLSQFLAMPDNERMCSISYVKGRVTWLADFTQVYESTMSATDKCFDPAVFASLGFKYSSGQKRQHVCRGCKQIARIGCCPAYCKNKRKTMAVIHNMDMCCLQPGSTSGSKPGLN